MGNKTFKMRLKSGCRKKTTESSLKFVFVFLRILDDVVVKVLGRERLDLFVELCRRRLTRLLLFAQEDGRVPVDPVPQRLVAVVALVNDRLEFAVERIEDFNFELNIAPADVTSSSVGDLVKSTTDFTRISCHLSYLFLKQLRNFLF